MSNFGGLSNGGDLYTAVEGGSYESRGYIDIDKSTRKVKKSRNNTI